jgi:energy-converting hydrogenase Eha subunit E
LCGQDFISAEEFSSINILKLWGRMLSSYKIWCFHKNWMQSSLLGWKAVKYGVTIQCFRDCLCLHYKGWCEEWHDCLLYLYLWLTLSPMYLSMSKSRETVCSPAVSNPSPSMLLNLDIQKWGLSLILLLFDDPTLFEYVSGWVPRSIQSESHVSVKGVGM